jgi:hypothetical protein
MKGSWFPNIKYTCVYLGCWFYFLVKYLRISTATAKIMINPGSIYITADSIAVLAETGFIHEYKH